MFLLKVWSAHFIQSEGARVGGWELTVVSQYTNDLLVDCSFCSDASGSYRKPLWLTQDVGEGEGEGEDFESRASMMSVSSVYIM